MPLYPQAAVERAMNVNEIIMRVYNGQLKWVQAAEILGVSDRQMRRLRVRYEQHGYDGLVDQRTRRPNRKRVPVDQIQTILTLYREKYRDFNVKHFHEKLQGDHGVKLGYTFVKLALQSAGLVAKEPHRGTHRKRRERRPLPGMMLHLDGSTHAWLGEARGRFDLLAVLDDATSEVYAAQFVLEEDTRSVMRILKEVVETQGVFCSLYTDRASHFVYTPKAKGPPDRSQPTQVERALLELGIELIPANSPQARGRGERLWETWQGRLPQELRVAGVKTLEQANEYIHTQFIPWHNRSLRVPAKEEGSAFVPLRSQDLNRIFAIVEERVVQCDNTIRYRGRVLQIPKSTLRYTYAKCRVKVYEHLDETLSVYQGPHRLGTYAGIEEGELRALAA